METGVEAQSSPNTSWLWFGPNLYMDIQVPSIPKIRVHFCGKKKKDEETETQKGGSTCLRSRLQEAVCPRLQSKWSGSRAHSPSCTLPAPQGSMMPSCNRSCSCSRGPSVEDGKWYGVRSYLHLFYEDCAGTALSDDPEGPPVLCPRRPWPSLCWKMR
eukprot:XP_016883565.1 neurensin-2 isoform X2 [Homo sapiens]